MIIANADDPQRAIEALSEARLPDMRKSVLHEPSGFDPDDPFDLG